MKISWIGCGNMGRPMAKNIIEGNHEVTVFDIFEKNMEPLIKLGAKPACSPAAAAKEGDFIFTMLPNGKILQNVVLSEKDGIINEINEYKLIKTHLDGVLGE